MDPPLPLARLRGWGQLTEIRDHDLRFTAKKADQFLNQVMELEMSALVQSYLESAAQHLIGPQKRPNRVIRQDMKPSEFYDPGRLIDNDLELVLVEKVPGDPAINYAPAYKFKMTPVGQDEEIGRIQLRVENTNHIVMYAGHIGYSVRPEHRGHRYAARACRLLLPLARRHGLKPLWITCSPDNVASRKTCELAGARLVEIVDLPEDTDMYRKGERQKCRYRIDI